MSILIKGIDMPKNCGSCDYLRDDLESSYCYLMDKDISDGTIRAEFCPLIEIPTPHGRLIDGDELCNDFSNRCPGDCGCCGESDDIYDCGLIINAPTILEAEE